MAGAFLSLTLRDAYGRTTVKLLECETQLLLADYITLANNVIPELLAITDLGLVKADLIIKEMQTPTDPAAGANVDVGATFSGWLTGEQGKKASLKIPGIKAALVDPDGSVPLTGDVATYLANYEDGSWLELSDGETIDTWISGTLDR